MSPSSPARVEVRPATSADAIDGVQPDWVAYPTSTAQVSQVLREAAHAGRVVLARGSGSKLTWGNPPSACDLVLDLSRMDRVLEHAAGDLIVSAQAGTPLASLQETVASTRQRLAVDEIVPGTTLGGLIATSPSGPRRMLHGTVRDLLIGITVVRADGIVAKAGGKVVKNVAGYDLGKLMIGSFGTLAIVTEATFRLHPIPEASTWLTVTVESPSAATHLIASIVHSQVVPAAVEIDAAPGQATTVSVLLEGTERGVAARALRTLALLGPQAQEHAGDPAQTLDHPGEPGERHTTLKLTCQISAAPAVAQAALDAGCQVRGSVGAGVLYAALSASAHPSDVGDVLATLRQLATSAGGACVVLDAPPEVKAALDVWGPVNGLALMQRVKQQFDPENRLAPGRFVGGI